MKASELRIGNWYKWNAEGKDYYYQADAKDFTSVNIPNFEPIPLTEEWLVSFGFEKNKHGVYLSPYENSINDECFTRMCFDFLEDKMFVVNSNAYDGFYVECNHVHQLQNLYFALTGEELELKQP